MMQAAWTRVAAALAIALAVAGCYNNPPPLQVPKMTGTKPGQPLAATNSQGQNDQSRPAVDPSKITRANYEKIERGMTEQQVKDILGPPSSETRRDNGKSTELMWEVRKGKFISCTFRDGKVEIVNAGDLDKES
jgi:outer membrane protein assembly factor BamE (lipoprotein component of BamABCDE complex)